jgi:hypothetical protein
MNVCFLFEHGLPVEIADVMIRSVKAHMPAKIVQLTNMTTPKLSLVDVVRRKESDGLVDLRLAHQEDLPGDCLILDYDCVVQRDVSEVFQQPFDIAFTRRALDDKTVSQSVAQASPHNMGVIFQRPRGQFFWKAVREAHKRLAGDNWLDGQALISQAIRETTYDILELPGEVYNHTPLTEDEDVTGRAILHYKGLKKAWMFKDPELRLKAKAAGKHVLNIMAGRR